MNRVTSPLSTRANDVNPGSVFWLIMRAFENSTEAFLPECFGTKPNGRWTRT